MIPRKFEPVLMGAVLSGLMSWVVSGVATWKAAGQAPDFLTLWMTSWLTAWLIAFPVVLLAAPLSRRLVQLVLKPK
ncbi:MAG: DUF2798 domain-containing protein [Burkholderiaceae bacterium]|nr:DUF2798 domain-containing protein [Burkholderiaceae bacterium]